MVARAGEAAKRTFRPYQKQVDIRPVFYCRDCDLRPQ